MLDIQPDECYNVSRKPPMTQGQKTIGLTARDKCGPKHMRDSSLWFNRKHEIHLVTFKLPF